MSETYYLRVTSETLCLHPLGDRVSPVGGDTFKHRGGDRVSPRGELTLSVERTQSLLASSSIFSIGSPVISAISVKG